jgi:Tol biopolymer transport system component
LGCASFAPFLHPDGKRIIFSTNYGDPKGREFDLWMINVDGTGLERITKSPEFDGFPMFTRNGKKLIWASNRHGSVQGETNLFTADWKN